jgi:hypothetical protein
MATIEVESNRDFAMEPFVLSNSYMALRKLMATTARMADKIKTVYAFFPLERVSMSVLSCMELKKCP